MAGLFAYLVGHGLVKGALFMIAGILLASLGGIDEIGLARRRAWHLAGRDRVALAGCCSAACRSA